MRNIWAGTISFGLVHIPVKLYNATREKRIQFHYLRKADLCPIRYVKVCRRTGEEVPYNEVVRGYEYKKGDYVVLQDEDFKKASAKKTQTIEIVEFVDASEIDLKLFEKPYFLEPAKEAEKAYVLLREALKRSGKIGIGKFVLRSQEYMGAIKPDGEILVLDQMRYADEIAKPSEINFPKASFAKKELDIAIQLIGQMTSQFKPEDFHNNYKEELRKFIQAKIAGKVPERELEAVIPTEIPDIMEKLKASLEYAKKKT